MQTNKLKLAAFFLLSIVQLAVPIYMIQKYNNILEEGKDYKFKLIPNWYENNNDFNSVLFLNFDSKEFPTNPKDSFYHHQTVYILPDETNNEFFNSKSVSKNYIKTENYLKVKIMSIVEKDSLNYIRFEFPFDKYNVQQSKMKKILKIYNEAIKDTTQVSYAIVSIKGGEGILKDIILRGKSIKNLIK